MRKEKLKIYILLLLTIVITVGNAYVWVYKIGIKKDTDFRYYHASYSDLYYPRGIPAIVGFDTPERNKLVVKLNNSIAESWQVFVDDKQPYEVMGNHPEIKIINKAHTYRLVSKKPEKAGWDFSLRISYTPAEYLEIGDNSTPDIYHVVRSSIPIGDYEHYSTDDFIVDNFPDGERDKVRTILENDVQIKTNDDAVTKIRKIMIYLLNRLDDKRGVPSDKILSASPYSQYQIALSNESKVWCENYSSIYSYFSNVAGVPTRIVKATGRIGKIRLSGHTFTESFIKEANQWAIVDLTSKKLFVMNENDDYMNALDLFHINRTQGYGGLQAYTYNNGVISSLPYSEAADYEKRYFSRDAIFIYKTRNLVYPAIPEKLRKIIKIIIFPDFKYSLSSSNVNYHITLGLFYGGLTVFLLWAIMLVRLFVTKKGNSGPIS